MKKLKMTKKSERVEDEDLKYLKKIIQERLKEIGVVINEEVELAHGEKSKYYIDVKKSYGYSDVMGFYLLYITEYFEVKRKKIDCIAGAGFGGALLAIALSQFWNVNSSFVRDIPKNHGIKNKMIDGYEPQKGDRVLLVDDVFTTGKSLKKARKILEETGAKIVGIFVIVNRSRKLPKINGKKVIYILTPEDLA